MSSRRSRHSSSRHRDRRRKQPCKTRMSRRKSLTLPSHQPRVHSCPRQASQKSTLPYRELPSGRLPIQLLLLAVTLLLRYSFVTSDEGYPRQLRSRHLQMAESQETLWNLDYKNRLANARSAGRMKPSALFLRWLHIPKTGTSFVNTLVRWGCPLERSEIFVVPRKERPRDMHLALPETFSWDWLFNNQSGRTWLRKNCAGRLVTRHPITTSSHYSLYMHRGLKNWESTNAVALFRLPLQRMYSNYMHLSFHYNESRTPRQSLQSFLRKKQFWSQQAKMVLGRDYRDERPVSRREAYRAAFIVKNRLKFIGLTEEFQLSCRLFHAMFGGVPHRAQFENIRPGIFRYNSSESRSSSFRYNEDEFEGWSDSADDIVYEAAKRRFWNDVRRMKADIEVDGLGEVIVKTSDST